MDALPAQTELCKVCGASSNLYRFGIFCCRACCAFFRRSVAQNKHYNCKHKNRCIIDQEGMRNACRACRMRRCYEVGMKPEELCLPQNNSSTGSASTSLPCISNDLGYQNGSTMFLDSHSPIPNRQYPILKRLSHHFQSLSRAQKSLYTVENPQMMFAEVLKPITKPEYMRFESASFTLIHSIIMETMDLFGDFVQEEWAAFTRPYVTKYATLHKAFITSQTTQNPEGTVRISTHYGYYLDKDSLKHFYKAPQYLEERIKIVTPIIQQVRQLADRLIEVQLREIEAAALCAIMLFEYMRRNGQLDDRALQRKEALYAEIHANLIETYGLEAAGVRLISIMPFIVDIAEIQVLFKELVMMSRIFIPPEPDDQECKANTIWANEECAAQWG
ncbi:zinc finger, c4 type (two domains) domain-containing protein [Ditylenchus destructor]|uniref:Zinc finger, c4 type (Two domains) domain-containing protein n=1 Tax=Ditylenchus destructor TaxID=166010 RepID=A0AAD4QW48_9BILA|nr:zinc finger, c4 type (two domains) domain-containing protein [Ditylenchus destructor]